MDQTILDKIDETLHSALETQSLEEFQKTLENYVGNINALNNQQETPLYVVCKRKFDSIKVQLGFASLLIDRGADICSIMNSRDESPIRCAYLACNINMIELMLKNISEKEIICERKFLAREFFYKIILNFRNTLCRKGFIENDQTGDYEIRVIRIIRSNCRFYYKLLFFYSTLLYADEKQRLNSENFLLNVQGNDLAKASFYIALSS